MRAAYERKGEWERVKYRTTNRGGQGEMRGKTRSVSQGPLVAYDCQCS